MTNWDELSCLPAAATADAVRRICNCFTLEDKEILKIDRNGQIATVEEQLIARWWNYLPKATCPMEFRAKVLQVLDTQHRWIELLAKVKQQDIFAALMDPENYKDRHKKTTKAKSLDKRLVDIDSASSNLVKSIGRSIGGDGAINRAYDYGKEWDEADRQRLDAVKFERGIGDKSLVKTETGEEDDTPIPKEESWIDKKERLDQIQGHRLNANKPSVKFGNIPDDGIVENNILLFDAQLAQSTNATSGDNESSTNTFIEGLKRQNFEIVREQLKLADALKDIQNIEFLDIRERFYKYFDPLFYLGKPKCR